MRVEAYLRLRNYMEARPLVVRPQCFLRHERHEESGVGTITADEDRYVAWNSADGDYSQTRAAGWSTMLDGMLRKDRLLDLVGELRLF